MLSLEILSGEIELNTVYLAVWLEVGITMTRRDSSKAGLSGMANSDSAAPELRGSQISPSQQGPLGSLSNGGLPLLGGQPLSRVRNGAKRYPETVEALRDVGRLQDKHKSLEARVERLESGKANKAHVHQLGEQLSAIQYKQQYKESGTSDIVKTLDQCDQTATALHILSVLTLLI